MAGVAQNDTLEWWYVIVITVCGANTEGPGITRRRRAGSVVRAVDRSHDDCLGPVGIAPEPERVLGDPRGVHVGAARPARRP